MLSLRWCAEPLDGQASMLSMSGITVCRTPFTFTDLLRSIQFFEHLPELLINVFSVAHEINIDSIALIVELIDDAVSFGLIGLEA